MAAEGSILFSFENEYTGRVKALHGSEPGRRRSAAGLHASLDSLYRTARAARQVRSGVTAFPLALLPRRCPRCGPTPSSATANGASRPTTNTTTGSGYGAACAGRVEKPSPSFRTGRRPTASTAFAAGNKPGNRVATAAALGNSRRRRCKDPNRLPDPATLRRWACRRLLSVLQREGLQVLLAWLANLFARAHHPCLGLGGGQA